MSSQDYSKLLEDQIANLQEEMGIDPTPLETPDVQEQVVEQVQQEDKPKTVSRKPSRNYKKLVEKVDVQKVEAKAVKKVGDSGTSFGTLLNEMFNEPVETPKAKPQPKAQKKPQRVIKESVEVEKVNPFRKPVSVEELSASMHQMYNNDVKDFVPESSTTMSPATVKALSDNMSFRTKDEYVQKEEFFMDNGMVITEKLKNLQMQMNALSTQFSAVTEGTLVSGIGQGGDGQLPGSGEVQLKYMDDVSIDNITDGDTLIWDSSNGGGFVPGAGGGAAGGAVDRLVSGLGIDITPPGGIGIVQIDLDASIQDLADVESGMTPLNGDLLVL